MTTEKDVNVRIIDIERAIKYLKHEIRTNDELIEQTEKDLVLSGWDYEDRSTMNRLVEDLEKENEIYRRKKHKLERELDELQKTIPSVTIRPVVNRLICSVAKEKTVYFSNGICR